MNLPGITSGETNSTRKSIFISKAFFSYTPRISRLFLLSSKNELVFASKWRLCSDIFFIYMPRFASVLKLRVSITSQLMRQNRGRKISWESRHLVQTKEKNHNNCQKSGYFKISGVNGNVFSCHIFWIRKQPRAK